VARGLTVSDDYSAKARARWAAARWAIPSTNALQVAHIAALEGALEGVELSDSELRMLVWFANTGAPNVTALVGILRKARQ